MSYLKSLQTEDATTSFGTSPSSLEAASKSNNLTVTSGQRERAGNRQETRSANQTNATQSGGEDIFLEMAVDETNRLALDEARNERRRSRIALASQRSSLSRQPSNSTMANDDLISEYGSRTEVGAPGLASLERRERRPSTLVASGDRSVNGSRISLSRYTRDSSIGHASVSGSMDGKSRRQMETTQHWQRRPSLTPYLSPDTSYYHTTHGSSPQMETAAATERLESRSQTFSDISESIDSTPASMKTLWDDVDELKSSARRLELSGQNRPSSRLRKPSEPGDRPGTATTTQTSGIGTAYTHPNLHIALAKAKVLLDPTMYRTLERIALDAIDMASSTSSAGPQGTNYTAASIVNGTTVAERQLRRKADNMCRNVTDLCVALCEARSSRALPSQSIRPMSRDTLLETPTEDPSPLSALDARRATRFPLSRDGPPRPSTSTDRSSSRISQHRPSTTHRTDSRLSNYESVAVSRIPARRGHIRLLDDDDDDDDKDVHASTTAVANNNDEDDSHDNDPTLRAPSRAMTETGASRPTRRLASRYAAREYTSRHPLPAGSLSEKLRLRAAAGQVSGEARSGLLSSSSPISPSVAAGLGRGGFAEQGLRREVREGGGL